jgi:hypothetical protein
MYLCNIGILVKKKGAIMLPSSIISFKAYRSNAATVADARLIPSTVPKAITTSSK